MDRASLVNFLKRLDIKIDESQSTKNKIVAYCAFAPYTHKQGKDKRPSFAAFPNEEGNSGFLCMACHEKGTIRKLAYKLGKLRGKDYGDLVNDVTLSEEFALSHFPEYEQAVGAAALSDPPEPLDEDLYYGVYDGVSSFGVGARGYLKKRGVSKRTAEKLSLLYDGKEDRILFPVRDKQGRLFGYTGRSLLPDHPIKIKDYHGLPKRWLILGQERWNSDNAGERRPSNESCGVHSDTGALHIEDAGFNTSNITARPIIIVEGLFAYAHLHEIGIEEYADIGALLGSVLTDEKANLLLEENRPVYLLLDNDAGGDLGLFGTQKNGDHGAVGKLIGHIPLYVPLWPDGKSDPDELTKEEVLQMLDETLPFSSANL